MRATVRSEIKTLEHQSIDQKYLKQKIAGKI